MDRASLDAILREDLLNRLLPIFCSKHIFDRIPYVFGDDAMSYITWKAALGTMLGIDPRDLIIVGSAAVGVSLDPKGTLRPFHDGSDIDVAVISQRHFDAA